MELQVLKVLMEQVGLIQRFLALQENKEQVVLTAQQAYKEI